MWKKGALLLFTVFLPHLGLAAPVREFRIENRESLNFQLTDEDWQRLSNKVYNFVTGVIPDSRPWEPITIYFDADSECAGFTSRDVGHLREIRISSKIRSHVDFQVVLAHELTHVLRHMTQPDEAFWLDEGLAKWMEWNYIGDFPTEYADEIRSMNLIQIVDAPLGCDGSHSEAYASAYFLTLYLHNHLGGDAFIRELATSRSAGWENIEQAASALRSEGLISINPELLKREKIGLHFAFSWVLNDPFLADFALFQLDPRYSPSLVRELTVDFHEGQGLRSCRKFVIETTQDGPPAISEVSSHHSSAGWTGSDRLLSVCF